jgi:hypothetical protein
MGVTIFSREFNKLWNTSGKYIFASAIVILLVQASGESTYCGCRPQLIHRIFTARDCHVPPAFRLECKSMEYFVAPVWGVEPA